MLDRLLAWCRRLLGLPERREVFRLPASHPDADGRTPDAVREDVQRRGPLSPGHRRQIVRDERLMPKPPKRTALGKPPKIMPADQAGRLFAATLRTGNRELRTLDWDAAQLARIIHAPKRRLKAILRTLDRELVAKLPVSDHAHGFVKRRSVKTGAALHVGRPVLLRLDLKDFLPSVTSARVRGLLIALGYGYPVAATPCS